MGSGFFFPFEDELARDASGGVAGVATATQPVRSRSAVDLQPGCAKNREKPQVEGGRFSHGRHFAWQWGHFLLDDAHRAPGCPAAPEEAATHPHHHPLRHPRRHPGGLHFRQARPLRCPPHPPRLLRQDRRRWDSARPGGVCDTSSSHSHSAQLRISPSSTSSSSTSSLRYIWARSTSPSSVLIFWRCRERGLHPPAYYIPQRGMSILGPFRHVFSVTQQSGRKGKACLGGVNIQSGPSSASGGVVIENGRVLLIRRGSDADAADTGPSPGGTLELG